VYPGCIDNLHNTLRILREKKHFKNILVKKLKISYIKMATIFFCTVSGRADLS